MRPGPPGGGRGGQRDPIRHAPGPDLGLFGSRDFLRSRVVRILDTRRSLHGRLSATAAVSLATLALLALPYVLAQQRRPTESIIPGQATGQSRPPDWLLGKEVILRREAELRIDECAADGWKRVRVFTVKEVDGQRLRLIVEGLDGCGWSRAGDAIPLDRAINYLDDEIRARPDNPWGYLSRGAVWLEQGEYDLAIADLGNAIRLDPGGPEPYVNRSAVWACRQQYEPAIADLDEAIAWPRGTA